MSDPNAQPQKSVLPATEMYTDTLEAHIIADMLRIEQLTVELREFRKYQEDKNASLAEDIKDLKQTIVQEIKETREASVVRDEKIERWLFRGAAAVLTLAASVLGPLIIEFLTK